MKHKGCCVILKLFFAWKKYESFLPGVIFGVTESEKLVVRYCIFPHKFVKNLSKYSEK